MRPCRSAFLAFVAILVFVGGLVVTPARAAAPKFPAFTGYVVDDAGILSPSTRAQLTQTLGDFQRTTKRQVVVATVKSLQGYPIEDYGYQLGRAWGVGEKGKDTGAILLVAPNERAVRIEVGYGLEGELTDALSKRIIETAILPAFRSGDFNAGVVNGTAAILRVLGGQPGGATGASGAVGRPSSQLDGFVQSAQNDPRQLAIFLITIFVFVLFAFLRAHGFYGSVYPQPYGVWRRRSGGGFYPGGGGFPSGGGFGGGGGGSFGGGGASGRW